MIVFCLVNCLFFLSGHLFGLFHSKHVFLYLFFVPIKAANRRGKKVVNSGRKGERKRERDRETERQRKTGKDRERQRDRKRETEKDNETERERQRD